MRRGLLIISAIVAAGAAVAPATAAGKTKPVWLCKPGIKNDPCDVSLKTTLVSPTAEQTGVDKVKAARHPKIDCFYVYPTVSDQPTPAANLDIDPVLRSIALYQAARYAERCRVFAPVYRQITLTGFGLSGGGPSATPEMIQTAYRDVLNAWKTYLKKYNHGRGVVLIGHSQGTFNLTRLVQEEIDPRRKERRRLVSAILLGGDVTVRADGDVGGDFQHVKACRSNKQIGCVIAFSTFGGTVPDNSAFGRTSEPGLQVLCTNPAALGGGPASLRTINPTEPFAPGTIKAAIDALGLVIPAVSTPWVETGAYSGECSTADDASVLQITGAPGAPQLNAVPPSFGLHLADGNIALGNLVDVVRKQAKKFAKKRG